MEKKSYGILLILIALLTGTTTSIILIKIYVVDSDIELTPPEPSEPIIDGPDSVIIDIYTQYSAISTNPEGYHFIYTFNFGDGYTWSSDLIQSGLIVYHSHTYTSVGNKTLTVTVQNTIGGENENSKIVEVVEPTNTAPKQPNPPSGPDMGWIDTSYEFNFSVTDPEGDDIKYEIDWGNGTSTLTEYYSSGTLVTSYHQWADEGTYDIKVRAQDEHGLWSNWSSEKVFNIILAPSPPNQPDMPIGPDLAYVGQSLPFKFKTIDQNGDDVSFLIDWGDNLFETTDFVESGSLLEIHHTYSTDGYFAIKAKARDNHSVYEWSDWSLEKSINIELGPSQPTKPDIGGPDSVFVNTNAMYSAVSIDPNGYHLIYTFNFGDGYTWCSDLVQSGVRVYQSHTYTSVGDKTLTVTVQNTQGEENENSKTIEVVIPPNTAPNQPNPPSGRDEGWPDTSYGFSFSTTDSEEDNIRYEVDWGDGSTTLTNYYSSGTLVTSYHQWDDEGDYYIKVRAQDEHGLWSSWSNSHIITIDTGPI